MQTFILTGQTSQKRAEYIRALTDTAVELIHVQTEKTSLTIKQIHELSSSLVNKPRLDRLVWIEEANLLTIPAQNALLKMLEEPPQNTSFYLSCDSPFSLLPTIRSRSKLIALHGTSINEDPAVLAELKEVLSLSPGDRLMRVVKRDRQESILWLTQIELALKDKFHDSSLKTQNYQALARIASLAQNTRQALTGNASISLATQTFYLLLPHTHPSR